MIKTKQKNKTKIHLTVINNIHWHWQSCQYYTDADISMIDNQYQYLPTK